MKVRGDEEIEYDEPAIAYAGIGQVWQLTEAKGRAPRKYPMGFAIPKRKRR